MQITPHFSLAELTRTDTGLENDPGVALAGNMLRLAETLEQIRDLVGCPIKINSGFRSEAVNQRVHGVKTSAHLFARAADFVPRDVSLKDAFNRLRASSIQFDQLILEPTWIHIGIACLNEQPRRESMTGCYGDSGAIVYAHV